MSKFVTAIGIACQLLSSNGGKEQKEQIVAEYNCIRGANSDPVWGLPSVAGFLKAAQVCFRVNYLSLQVTQIST